jgi:hypothetical protein
VCTGRASRSATGSTTSTIASWAEPSYPSDQNGAAMRRRALGR